MRPSSTAGSSQHQEALPAYPQGGDGSYPPEKQTEKQQVQAQAQHSRQQSVEAPAQPRFVSGAPPAGQFVGAGEASLGDDVGTFNGGSFRVSHRDTNTVLTIQLAMGCPMEAKPGAMVAMSPTMTLKGAAKFTMKRLVAGGDIGTSTFIGPGELLLAPYMLGDITCLRLGGNDQWSVGQDSYLASTQGIYKDYKRQGLAKAMFSGEGLWVYKISGKGLLWLTSFGAIIRKDVSPPIPLAPEFVLIISS